MDIKECLENSIKNKESCLKSEEEKRKKEREKKRKQREKIKNNPEAREKFREKYRENYEYRKACGRIKLIAELSPQEQIQKRNEWKASMKQFRQKKKQLRELLPKNNSASTPSNSKTTENNRKLSEMVPFKIKRSFERTIQCEKVQNAETSAERQSNSTTIVETRKNQKKRKLSQTANELNEQKRISMRKTRERWRNDPIRWEEEKRKGRERYLKRKKPVDDMSEQVKRSVRKKWREQKRNQRIKLKEHTILKKHTCEETSDGFDLSFLEPEVVIKEEPIDNDEDPTMSRLDHEFILPCTDSYQPCSSPAIKEVFTVVKTEPMEESQQITSNCMATKPNKRQTSETADVAKQINSNGRTTKPSSRKAAEKDNVLELTESNPADEDAATSKTNSSKDSFDVYGDYIAAKLRNLDLKSCTCVQKAFADILFDAEMGKFK